MRKDINSSLTKIKEYLKINDFSERYTNRIIEQMMKELSVDVLNDFNAAQDHLLELIGDSINIYSPIFEQNNRGKIIALVGPARTGKTTTIAKLTSAFGVKTDKRSAITVRIITADPFQSGAKAQLDAIGNALGIPVSYVENQADFRKEITLYVGETDLFLVDTICMSPENSAKLNEMKELLESCLMETEVHLVISANTKANEIEDTLNKFEPFNYRSVLVTKMDEVNHIGNIISAVAESKKSFSYITNGPIIPYDIKEAAVLQFLEKLDHFNINRAKMEKRFLKTKL